jgi:hypothetical protein
MGDRLEIRVDFYFCRVVIGWKLHFRFGRICGRVRALAGRSLLRIPIILDTTNLYDHTPFVPLCMVQRFQLQPLSQGNPRKNLNRLFLAVGNFIERLVPEVTRVSSG